MKSLMNQDERIELRVASKDKKMLQRAQKLSGDRSFNSFIIRIVKKEAEEIVAKNDRIIMTEKDQQVFFDAVFADSMPNSTLVEAAKRFKAKTA